MRKSLTAVFLLLACLLPVTASAAVHYIRAGATGSGTGSDWYNAWTTLPSTLVRGDTYYIADGSYGSYTFDDALSGSSWIYIKKATVSSHGTGTGWVDSYGDGVAVFTAPLTFKTGFYEVDGQAGGGPKSFYSGHGIKVQHTGTSSGAKIISVPNNVSNLTFKHMEMSFNPCSTCTGQDVFYSINGGSNYKFQYNYMHHPSRVVLYTINVSDILIENTVLERSGVNGASTQHSEIWSARDTHNVTLRYSVIKDYRSTGGIIMGRAKNWEIYGNVFQWSQDFGATANNGAIGSWSSDPTYYASNVNIYNNTFVGLKSGGAGKIFPIYKSISAIKAYNNMWYNSPAVSFGGPVAHDYNWFKNSNEGTVSETHKEVGTGDPFVSSTTGNFRLKAATGQGYKLTSPYNLDMDGSIRSVDGVWDKGAYEYKSGSVVKPLAPTNLTIN